MIDIYNELIDKGISKDNILLNEPMSKHTSFKVGGEAKYFIRAFSKEEIINIQKIASKNNIPIFILGNGTNILVKDEGYNGIIIQVKIDNIELIDEAIVNVGAGVKNAILSQFLLKNKLTGFEFASGIPGTIGGAIKMNAGAYGREFKDIVKEVTYIDKEGNIHKINNEECNFSYRHSRFFNENDIIIESKLEFTKGDSTEIESKIKDLTKKRKENQPLEYPNAGSIFRRGEDYITAKLIDECGLKGYSIGGAEVSTKHAGFIINKNNATAEDIIDLIEYVKTKVKERTGKDIKLELDIIGG